MQTLPTTLPTPTAELSAGELDGLLERAASYAREAKSPATRRAYAARWKAYAIWCRSFGVDAMPIDVAMVVRYLGHLADEGRSVATIMQTVAAMAHEQRAHGHAWKADDNLRAVLEGIRRQLGVRPRGQRAPLDELDLRRAVGACGESLLDVRDRALLLCGWVGAFRRSELVALDVADLEFSDEGLVVLVRASKTDKEGAGLRKALPRSMDSTLCPALTMRTWLDRAGITEGPVFRRLGRNHALGARLVDAAVAKVVKARLRKVGIDPARYAGHSLRAGFVTAAAKHQQPLDAIMRQTGHQSPATVIGYIRMATPFEQNAAKGIL